MDDLDQRLTAAINQRNKLAAEAQRIAGKKEAAERALSDLRDEIRSKNLDPDQLDETLQKLNEAFASEVAAFEAAVDKAQRDLSPYMEIR